VYYRPPARYLPSRRRFPRYRSRGASPWAAAAAAAAILVAATRHPPAAAGSALAARHGTAVDRVTARVLAYAEAQLGKPYLWGGTGPDAFDCSGLAMEAWSSAGVSIRRTSRDQWASERHVPSPRPGDLVFFAGSDGSPSAPGHVGIVVSPDQRLMIEAYATGYPIRYSHYGTPSAAPGDEGPVGFTDPAGGS
jgi:cell wall-associated NlpC family hydrolase